VGKPVTFSVTCQGQGRLKGKGIMPKRYHIAVVGCGLGGAATAFLLARAGHRVEMFERSPRVGAIGAGILLQPSGQLVLQQLGLLEEIALQGEPIEELHALTSKGRTLIRMHWADAGHRCRAYGLHRGQLFTALYERVQAQGVAVHLSHDIQAAVHLPRSVLLCDAERRQHGPFDFAVAADGSRSILRGSCRFRTWTHSYAYGAAWAIGRCEAVRGRLHQVVRGTRHLLGLLPMGGGRCSLFWSLRRDQQPEVWNAGFPRWRDAVLRLCPLAEELFTTVRGFDQVTFTTYQHAWMARWHDGRLLFLGDAAHAMSPHLGQGVNLALIDALELTRAIGGAATPEQAFARYSAARRSQLRYYGAITFLLTPFFQSGGWIKGWGRDVALPLMTRVPGLRRRMAVTMAGLQAGFLHGRWKPY
jgi:2-polyprenyl-6-methoxyphenol hydroxylase-like FAD-dependent oxidoreductase